MRNTKTPQGTETEQYKTNVEKVFTLRNTKTPQGTETAPICLPSQRARRIEKYEDPAGDGNIDSSSPLLNSDYIIEKYEDPAGDGNREPTSVSKKPINIEKYEDPAGDGNC